LRYNKALRKTNADPIKGNHARKKGNTMLNSQQTLSAYENILLLTQQMLEAAKIGDRQQMQALEDRFNEQIKSIKSAGGLVKLSGELRTKKVHLLNHILDNDRAIRDITDPWLKELSAFINNTGNQALIEMSQLKNR
jgi:flagellar protein FliT